ncbi:MAG: FixH family protein [Truepera sp.]|nr:FixH family protein [Truepera sp.]
MMRPLALAVLWCLASVGLAHAFVVIGTLSATPQTPQAGEPFTLLLTLEDPTRTPVPRAVVFAEFRPAEQPEAVPIRADFAEISPGTYQATLSLPTAGSWTILMRDQTYPQEETNAELTFLVGEAANPEALTFIFPPTVVPPENLWAWLGWLIGLPLLAAVVVTVLVLRSKPAAKAA